MSLRNITMKQLRALSETVRTGSVTGAADRLNVTPPAISLQLKQLEGLAQIPLLQRTSTGFQPTDAGRVVVEAAHRLEELVADCDEAVSAIRGVESGTVRVGAISTAKYFTPRVLAAYSKEHPGIDLRLSVGNRGETVAALEDMDLDFAVMGRPPRRFAVDQAIIGAHPHIVIGPPDHPLAHEKSIDPANLSSEIFLLREPGSGTRLLTERLAEIAGATPSLGTEIDSNETIKQAVMAGLGIALISAHTVSVEIADGRLAMLDVRGMPVMRVWYVVRRADKHLMPGARALWDFMAERGSEFLPAVNVHPPGPEDSLGI